MKSILFGSSIHSSVFWKATMYRITEEHEWRVTGADPDAQIPGSGGSSESRKGEWGKVLQQNGGIWSVFKVSFNFHGQNLMNILTKNYLITYVDRYYSSSQILTILDFRRFILTVGKKSKPTLTL
jgi:hypothetical protein